MKCKDCDFCKKGWFKCEPENYVCIGVKHPFIIKDIDRECTEYPEKTGTRTCKVSTIYHPNEAKAYVGNDGIYVPGDVCGYHKLLMSRELFVEAYNKYILANKSSYEFYGQDDADDWSED